ncbi:hypothetical protein FIBSPDRAFT_1012499 [Athelia psychrophila]|uniref:C4-dicarboxylate transporter/malic acid transport protein n=1 Tax=Athelia psychrophila TaxID=1759441 RepID=A0A166MLV4_9AGAM|nr:hypothetical protein FIBSPDRAFT_1012499 [Fibularhizoctonia sp. CBS 109695]
MSRSPSFGSLETAAPEPLEDLTDQRGAIDNDHAATCTSPRLATACTDLEKENPLVFSLKAHGLRERIIRFTPSWFSVTMGTGIQNSLLFNLPWARTHPAFRAIGAGFLIIDIILFISFAMITIARYIMYPEIFMVMLLHDTHSLFLGTIPMGFVTIVTGIALLGQDYGIGGGITPVLVASGLWWLALAMACFTACIVPYAMFTKHHHSADQMTAAWLLPIGATTTTVSSAVLSFFPNLLAIPAYALTILLTSYIMDGIGLLLASMIMALYFQRLAVHHLPAREVIISTFLPLGPCGQGGYALIELGRNAMTLFPILAAAHPENEAYASLASIGSAMYGSALATGLLLFGLGLWWLFLAVVTVSTHYVTYDIAFNMGAWGVTFPLGSLALLTFSLGNSFDSLFFKVVAAGMTLVVFTMWWLVAVPTVRGFYHGTLFESPCLSSLPEDYARRILERQRSIKKARKLSSNNDAGLHHDDVEA